MKKTLLSSVLFATLAVSAMSAQASEYPNLPEVIAGSGTGTLVGDTLYVGLGSGSDLFYSLDLKQKDAKWQALPAFPGGARNQAVAAGVDGKLYVFGGFKNTEVADNQTANDAYSYDPQTKQWSKLITRSPFGSSAGTSAVTYKGQIYFIGGVNQNIWDGLFQDAKAAGAEGKDKVFDKYFNMPASDFFFNTLVASYEPKTNAWHNKGYFPYGGRAGASVAVKGNQILVVNGEIKAGLRTPSTDLGTIGTRTITWKALGDLPAPKGEKSQEGIAGAMGGYSNGTYIITGGANFPGARANYARGIMDAHRTGGLKKAYHNEVYALNNKTGKWTEIGKLDQNIGYGVAVSYNNKVLLVGGKTDGNKALTSVKTMSYDGKNLTVE